MNDQRTLPDSIQLVLPSGWTDFPLDESDHRTFVAQLTARGVDGGTLNRAQSRQVELAMAQLRHIALNQNVILASGVVAVDRVDGAPDNEGTLVIASVTGSVTRRVDLGTDVPLHPDVLMRAFSGRTDDSGTQFDEIEPPAKVDLAGSTAVKLVRLMRSKGSVGQELKQFTQSYLVPVAQGDALIILQFSTINLDYARQFSELFDKVAHTLRILFPDDPTFLDTETTIDGVPTE